MTIRYLCPISTCQWFHETVATDSASSYPPDVAHWTLANWADVPQRTGHLLTAVHVIDAHLSTHSPVEWLTELRREQRRAEDAEATVDRLLDAQEQTAGCVAAMHPVTSMRLPSLEQVEATQTALAGVANGGSADA